MGEHKQSSLVSEVESLQPHDHLCLIYETHDEWEAAVIPFIKVGLSRNEKCIYVADAHTADELRNYLSKYSIAAAPFEASGQLTILRESDVYTKEDSFDPDRIIRLLIAETEKAVSQGYPALRVTGEMTFVLKGVTGSERLLEYEAKLNRDLFPKYPCLAICQYDRWKFAPEIIKGVVMTHPKLIHGNRVSSNFYYIPTEDFLNHKSAELEVQHWLKNVAREEKRKEELEESEVRYRRLFEAAKDGILILNAESGIIKDINPYLLDLIGYSKQETLGKQLWQLGFFKDRFHSKASFRDLQEKGYIHYEDLPLETKDGCKVDVEFVSNSYLVNSERVIQCNIRDITKRKKAERELKLRAELLNNTVDAIFLHTLEGKFIYVNAEAYQSLGYSKDELLKLDLSTITAPGVNSKAQLEQLLEERQVIFESAQLRRDGSIITVEVHARIIEVENTKLVLSVTHDITERKRAEEAIKQSEAKYSSLVENSNDGIIIIENGILRFINTKMSEMTGFSPEGAVGRKFVDFSPSEEKAKLMERHLKRMSGEKVPETYETTIIHRDGHHIFVEVHASNTVYQGHPAVIAIIRDITERKQAEESLRRAEENFRNSLDNSPLGIRIVSKEGKTLYTNRSLLDIYGYDSIEALNTVPARQRYTPESYAKHKERQRKRERGEFVTDGYIVSIIRKDGEVRHLEVFRKEMIWDAKLETQVLYHDITERKKAEDNLRQERNLFVSGPTVVFKWLAVYGWPIEYVAPNVYGLLGYTAEELMVGNQLCLNMVHPDDAPRLAEANERAEQQADCGQFAVDYRMITKSGNIKWVHEHTTLIRDDQGAVKYHHGYVTDITEQKKAEVEKREMERKAQVTSRLASVGEMASGIAHEINNPLTSVVGFSELLMEKDLPEDLREDVETIHNGAKRVADIVKGLLTFARQHKPVRNRTSINEIIESTLALRKYALETSNIEVKTILDAELPWTVADAGQLQQVFLNIIVNAETEMKKAHGRGRLTIRTEQAGDRIRISFADDGPGIAGENLEKIFDPFFTTKEVGEGTGLGLSLSRGIITEHNGELYAESEEGKGATFFVELPVVVEEKEKVERVEEVEEAGKAVGGRILVVDDEPAILAFLKKVLGSDGYDVATAGSGREALEMIKEQGYGLIISDIRLPGLSGAELYDELGGIAPFLQKRVIFITGDVISADTREFLKKTRAPYINKPFDITILKQEVKRVITGKDASP